MEKQQQLCRQKHLLALLTLLAATLASAAPTEDLVTRLPGQPSVLFKQYAGYVTINSAEQKALFYYFVEAEENAISKPVTLWLNGGPGCSSLGGGAFTELGPFFPDPHSDGLIRNEKAWNKVSNVLFVDSPIGVGWSYSNLSSSYEQVYNDEKTSAELLCFLRGWFEKFPEYRHNDLFISGESYVGHYGPSLAVRVLDYNRQMGLPFFNLRGVLVGNPLLNNTIDSEATYEYLWAHGVITENTFRGIQNHCNYDNRSASETCKIHLTEVHRQMEDINKYHILVDVCYTGMKPSNWFAPGSILLDVCIESERTRYLNRQDVQQALHANTTSLPYPWVDCHAGPMEYSRESVILDMIPVLKSLLKQGLRIQLFSGDADSVLPFTGTRKVVNLIIKDLELHSTINHSPWYSDHQVAGWTQVNENLSFATVRGAGHMVAYGEPGRALTLFKAFVEGKHLPRRQRLRVTPELLASFTGVSSSK